MDIEIKTTIWPSGVTFNAERALRSVGVMLSESKRVAEQWLWPKQNLTQTQSK